MTHAVITNTIATATMYQIAASVKAFGENPTQYLLAIKVCTPREAYLLVLHTNSPSIKYIDALKQICKMKNTEVGICMCM